MKINLQIAKNQQFRSFYVFFVVSSTQLSIGIIGTPRIVFEEAGHDGWISIILAYFILLLILYIMLFILRQYENTDLLGVQVDLFGNFISKVIGSAFILYFLIHILATLMTYIEIIKVFVFPDSHSLVLGIMLISLIVYASLGGLRVVIGVVFLFTLFSQWLFLLLLQPISQMDWLNFLPVMDRDVTDILRGVAATAYTFTGFEVLFFIYPFIANKENIRKPLFLGISWSVFLALTVTVITIGFLSPDQLQRRIWPVLNLFKIQTSPIVERLDYLVVAEWMMVTVPRVILMMWCLTHIAKRVYNIPKKASLYVSSSIILVLIPFLSQHFDIQQLIDSSKYAALGLIYIYPFILLPLVILKKKFQKKRRGENNENG